MPKKSRIRRLFAWFKKYPIAAVILVFFGPLTLSIVLLILLKIVYIASLLITGPSAAAPIISPDSEEKQITESLKSWQEENLQNLPSFRFVDFCAVDKEVWAVGYRRGYHGYGYLLKSEDSERLK